MFLAVTLVFAGFNYRNCVRFAQMLQLKVKQA
jgi:hypothetical protein